MMTTLTVLATLVAVPFLFRVLLAVTLEGVMALHFAPDWVRAPRSGSAPRDRTRRYEGACSADAVFRAQHPGQIRTPQGPGSPAHP